MKGHDNLIIQLASKSLQLSLNGPENAQNVIQIWLMRLFVFEKKIVVG